MTMQTISDVCSCPEPVRRRMEIIPLSRRGDMTNLKSLEEARKKLSGRYQKVDIANTAESIGTAVHGIIDLVENNPVLKQTAEHIYVLEEGPTLQEWMERYEGQRLIPPIERNKKARLGYEILTDLYGRMGEDDLAFNRGIRKMGLRLSRSTRTERNNDTYAKRFVAVLVDPFVAYLDEELESLIADEEVKDELVSEPNAANSRNVFIVHGRDKKTLTNVVTYLKQRGLNPFSFEEAKELVETSLPTIIEVVDKGMAEAQAVLVLLTPDDEARLKSGGEESKGQARPNVIFEAGIAFGRYRKRTVLVEYEEPSMFSDLHGFYAVRLKESDGGIEGLEDLRKQLKVAGCELE